MSESSRSLQHLCRLASSPRDGTLSDGELLERITQNDDPAAFEVLVWRHGPMVLGVCRRMLGHAQDAEDAFQATFLTLVRKASSIAAGESLGPWLHTVAYRVACKARARRASRPEDVETVEIPVFEDRERAELVEVLDEEVQRLPEKYRVPVVLSYLEGLTNQEVADRLGCPIGTVFTRLSRARDKLRANLVRRGITLSSTALASLGAEAQALTLPSSLVAQVVKSALLFSGGVASAALSPEVVALTEGVLQMMSTNKLKVAVMMVLLAVVGSGTALIAWQQGPGSGDGTPPAQEKQATAERGVPRDALRYAGKSFTEWRYTLLTELKPDLRVEAIEALTAFGTHGYSKEATRTILDVARFDETFKVAQASRKALGKLPDTVTIPMLGKEIREGNARSRRFVLQTLGDFDHKGQGVASDVVSLLEGKNQKMQSLALGTLAQIDRKGKTVDSIVKVALGPHPDLLRLEALEALESIGTEAKTAVPALLKLAKDANPNMRESALEAIRYTGVKSETALRVAIAALGDEDHPGVQKQAAGYIYSMDAKAKSAVPALLTALKKQKGDTPLTNALVMALGSIGPDAKAALPTLQKLYARRLGAGGEGGEYGGGGAGLPGLGGAPPGGAGFPGGAPGGAFGGGFPGGAAGYPGAGMGGSMGDPIENAIRKISR